MFTLRGRVRYCSEEVVGERSDHAWAHAQQLEGLRELLHTSEFADLALPVNRPHSHRLYQHKAILRKKG